MLSHETLEEYRRMTVGQRLSMTLQMIRHETTYMGKGRPEVVARRFQRIQSENDRRNENILKVLARIRDRS